MLGCCVLQGCNVASVAGRVNSFDALDGSDAATGGVIYRVDEQSDSAGIDKQITACKRNGNQWTFLAGNEPVLRLDDDPATGSVTVRVKKADIVFPRSECSPVHLNVDATTGNGRLTLTCDKAAQHLGAGIRFSKCRG